MTGRLPVALLASLVACAPRVDGEWVGACETEDVGVRVWLTIHPDEPAALHLWLLSRPNDVVLGTCDAAVDGVAVDVSACSGAWQYGASPEPVLPVALLMSGNVEDGEPGNTYAGTCSWEGAGGTASMLRMASEDPDPETAQ